MLIMQPGPTPVAKEVEAIMSKKMVSFRDDTFISDMKEVIEDLKTIWRSHSAFVIPGTGTLGMEISICNSVKRGDRVLVVSHGSFGDRFVDICNSRDIEVDLLKSKDGTIVPVSEIKAQLKKYKYKAITVSHVDTSTGVKAPVFEIRDMLKQFEDIIFILDTVCSAGSERIYLDEAGADIMFTGSQKSFGMTPGLSIIWTSEKFLKRRNDLGKIYEFYNDLNNWLPVMEDPAKYFSTPPITLIWGLQKVIALMKKEGVEVRYDRHIRNAKAFSKGLVAMGYSMFVEKEEERTCSLANIKYPQGVDIDDALFRETMYKKGIDIASGYGPYLGQIIRISHMGNVDAEILEIVLDRLEETMVELNIPVIVGKGKEVFKVASQV